MTSKSGSPEIKPADKPKEDTEPQKNIYWFTN